MLLFCPGPSGSPFLNASISSVRNDSCETCLKSDTEPQKAKAHSCTSYLDHPFKNRHVETESNPHPLLANTAGWVYHPKSSPASSCTIDDTLMGWRSFCYDRCFDFSPAALGWLLACTLRSLDSLDETAHFLLATLHPGQPWSKQV